MFILWNICEFIIFLLERENNAVTVKIKCNVLEQLHDINLEFDFIWIIVAPLRTNMLSPNAFLIKRD